MKLLRTKRNSNSEPLKIYKKNSMNKKNSLTKKTTIRKKNLSKNIKKKYTYQTHNLENKYRER